VLIGYGGGFFLLGVAFPVAGIVFLIILATLALLDWLTANQFGLATGWRTAFSFYSICVCLALVLSFLGMTWFFLVDAQKYVADRERIRHWKEEPRAGRRQRSRAPRPNPEPPPLAKPAT
ncbi:MAG TPA: hypothetical protein VKU02_26725, partial [Gemmataceae bacterium]|nr:hypothetical protein [Gemmataceae bacterium]